MTYFANQLDWAVSFARYYEVSIFDTLPYIHEFLAEGYIDSHTYYLNLAMILIFNVVAAAVTMDLPLKIPSRDLKFANFFRKNQSSDGWK